MLHNIVLFNVLQAKSELARYSEEPTKLSGQ